MMRNILGIVDRGSVKVDEEGREEAEEKPGERRKEENQILENGEPSGNIKCEI